MLLHYSCLAPLILALWPVWIWYCQRLTDRSDEPLGIVALVTFFVMLWVHPERLAFTSRPGWTTGLLVVYGLAIFCTPKLVLAFVAVAAIGLCFGVDRDGHGLKIGDWALLFLSLPLVSSFNFYFGYPLRLMVCQIAVPLLNMNGFTAISQGTQLIYSGQSIEVDAPCSGVRMLWASLYLAATLASLRGMNALKGALFMILAVVLALWANVLRVTSLFYLESGTITVPQQLGELVHEGVGVPGFFLLAIALLLVAPRLAGKEACSVDANEDKSLAGKGANISEVSLVSTAESTSQPSLSLPSIKSPAYLAFFVGCAVCAVLPFISQGQSASPAQPMPEPKAGWFAPQAGEVLHPLPLSVRQGQIAAAFPGEIKIFSCGNSTVVYRCVTEVTRQLHPAADCYRAGGYQIKYLPPSTDAQGLRWGVTEASRGVEKLKIKERIFDDHGHSWIDVSTWYWAVLTGRTRGPWWSVMTVAPAAGP